MIWSYSHFSLVRTTPGKEKILYYRELLVSENFFFLKLDSTSFTLSSRFGQNFFCYQELLVSEKFLHNSEFPLWFYRLRQPSGLFWAKKCNNFLFQVQSFVQDRFNEDDIYLGGNRGTLLLKEVGKSGDKEKNDNRNFLCTFFGSRKMATDRASVADIRPWQLGQPRKQLRPPRRIEQMSFSAVCPTNFTVWRSYNYKNMYNLYVLSRNFEPADSAEWSCYWILRTIEFTYYWETKRLDLNRLSIWTTVFCTHYRELRVFECTYYREMTVFFFHDVSEQDCVPLP